MSSVDVKEPVLKGYDLAWIFLAGAIVAVTRHVVLQNPQHSLEWEDGRRKAKSQFTIKPTAHEYITNSRGVQVFTKRWLPADGNYKGLIVFCHGYGDSCSFFFEDIALRLATAQYAVASMDYEGHGQSQGRHVYIKKFDYLRDDMIEFCELIKEEKEFRDLPSFLYGESMGGAVAIKVHMKQPDRWKGAILVAPMCKIADDMIPHPAVVSVLKGIAPIFPLWKIVPTGDILTQAFKVPEKRVIAGLNPTAWRGPPRLWTAYELLRTTEEIAQNLQNVVFPMLILHGEGDTVTDPSVSKALFEQSKSEDKTLKLYPEAWHALTSGEPDEVVDSVFEDIFTWLDSRSLAVGESSIELWKKAVARVSALEEEKTD